MVAKNLIKVDKNLADPLKSNLDAKKTYISVSKYHKKYQKASECIKGCHYEVDAINSLKVGTCQIISIP